MAMTSAVSYYRVSTDKQGKSGLGQEAQQSAVQDYAKRNEITLAKEFVEIESGKRNDRPILLEALAYCKKNKAKLIIAKLDRLGRSVAFISTLMEAGVSFVAVDNPHATELILHIMAAFAQHERKAISTRTKEALQAAKRRGTVLGKNGVVLAKANKIESLEYARTMVPVINALRKEGFKTVMAITNELNKRKIRTLRNNTIWHNNSTQRLLKKIKSLQQVAA